MNEPILLNLAYLAGTEKPPIDYVKRDAILNQIDKNLETADVIIIEGDEGIGKTTILNDFIYNNLDNTISYSVNEFDKYTYTFDSFLEKIYSQIYFYCNGIESELDYDVPIYNSIQGQLRRKIKNKRIKLYFVLDGLDLLNSREIEKIIPLFEILPWKKAKFIFSGDKNIIGRLFNQKLIQAHIPVYNFSFHETKEYFKEITINEEELQKLHVMSSKGIPSRLKQLKLLYKNDINFLNDVTSEYNPTMMNYLEQIWNEIDNSNEVLNRVLSVVAFSDVEIEINIICEVLGINEEELVRNIENISFLNIMDNRINYEIESLRKFSKEKLKEFETETNSSLIAYYEKTQDSDISIFNLPYLYNKARLWEKLTHFFNIETFIHLLDKHQTIVNIHSHFSLGFDASKKSSLKFEEARLKFALHKSSVKELQKHELWESEIEALIVLGEYEQAIALCNSALLKEDRLKLLAIVAKQRKINNLANDPDLFDQIKVLYDQIDFSSIREKGFEISGLLIYINLQLAIELVEKVTDNNSVNNTLDYAYAYLTLYATEVNKKSNSQIADIDLINSKIKNNDVQNLTKALLFLSDEYSFEELINSVNKISKFSQKLFILKNWIKNNSKNKDVYKAIKFTLEEIVRTSGENVPNATSFLEIATPLSDLTNFDEINDLVLLFDAHKNTIDRPTKSYIQLQLIIAEAVLKINYEIAKDRIYDIFLQIEDLSDLSIKTDCLGFLWLWLVKNDNSQEIENSISSNETIELQTKKNIDLLLKDTAYHFKMIENIISTLIIANPIFVFDIIKKINTENRRDAAFELAIQNYISKTEIENFDFLLINKFNREIKNKSIHENLIILIIDKFYFEKEKVIPHITKITKFFNLISSISNIANKCYIICHSIKILNFNYENYEERINELLNELYISWNSIDILWEKIETGFLIARDLSDFSKDKAKEYLNFSTDLKQKEAFSSSSIVNTYIKSIKLSIKAFCGITLFKDDLKNDLDLINETLCVLQSTGEKLKLWSELYLKLNTIDKIELGNRIYRNYINPLLSEWSNNNYDLYKTATIVKLSPSLYLYNPATFFSDYWIKMDIIEKDIAIKNICAYIFTGLCVDDTVSNNISPLDNLEYSQINDVCTLIEHFDNDFLIFNHISLTIQAINKTTNINTNQRDSLKSKLRNIIDTKLPRPNGILHEGYKIVSEAELLSLEKKSDVEWNKLIKRADLIENISDRSFILVELADKMNSKTIKQVDLMERASELIKSIPSVYDKTNRYDITWEIWLNIDRSTGKFKKHLKIALANLLTTKDGEIAGIRNLVDMAHQQDPLLAEELITMLDDDPARKKLKQPLLARMENKNKIEKARNQNKLLTDLNCDQFQEVFRKNLLDLNEGKRVSKDISETFEILEKASNHSLIEAFDSYVFFIQNAIKRYTLNIKEKDILSSIFSATIENTKLIGILSSDNISKMKNLYTQKITSESNPIISPGEQQKAATIFTNWFRDNLNDELIIIDPYFTEKELEILKIVQEIKPDCNIKILTSKAKKRNNSYVNTDTNKSINKDIYINHWKSISVEEPLNTKIKIVWDRETFDTPFHDRWLVDPSVKKGLKLGTSFNGFGNKESGIEELNEDSYINVEEIINKYLYKEETKVGNFHLKYESFDLED